MSLHEIVLPETKPETEWVRGRALQKVSPTYQHGVVQRRLGARLGDWADSGRHGRVATEWRFRVMPHGEPTRPLVPDVAFVSYSALPVDAAPDQVMVPSVAPTVAFEILSPDDRSIDVESKAAVYLAAGASAVIVIDPATATIVVYDDAGRCTYGQDLPFRHRALPDFALDVRALFDGVR